MRQLISRLFRRQPVFQPGPVELPRLILTKPSVVALQSCLDSEIKQGKEGIAYLLGQSDGTTTLVVSVIRPQAQTTRDSFSVSSPAMAQVVRTTISCGLQVVGQAHTHPCEAYHSEGDEKGARIAYCGYVSVVFPNYGRHLPALDGAASYSFQSCSGFVPIEPDRITVVPGRIS